MAILAIKTNMNIMDRIVLLADLHLVENLTLCNKHFGLLARHVGFVTEKILIDELLSSMNNIWWNHNL